MRPVTLESIQGARAVRAELLSGNLVPCVRPWTSRQALGLRSHQAQQLLMLADLGKVRGSVERQGAQVGLLWGAEPLFPDAPAHPAPSSKALPAV